MRSSSGLGADGLERREELRIACAQFAPSYRRPDLSAATVRRMTADIAPGSIDMLVLPEMALSGYVFEHAQQLASLLEDPSGEGKLHSPSYTLAAELAVRLECYVCIGMPCRASYFEGVSRSTPLSAGSSPPFDARPVSMPRISSPPSDAEPAFNASMIVDAQGSIVHVFRKHFSYENDKVWASEGGGFETVTLNPKFGKVCVAICMDINPYDFRAPFDSYELANFCHTEQVDVLLMNLAWLTNSSEKSKEEEGTGDSANQDEVLPSASIQHCDYLALRLSPCYRNVVSPCRTLAFVACNRIGHERGSTFGGNSLAMQFTSGRPPLLRGIMGPDEQGVAIFTVHTEH